MTLELHFSVTGNGGLRLPFHGITGYLHGLVSVYERPIIAGGRVWMAYNSSTHSLSVLMSAKYVALEIAQLASAGIISTCILALRVLAVATL